MNGSDAWAQGVIAFENPTYGEGGNATNPIYDEGGMLEGDDTAGRHALPRQCLALAGKAWIDSRSLLWRAAN